MSAEAIAVGLIADTHGLLRPEVLECFAGVQLIVHAGDVGRHDVLDRLRELAPVEAVSGNVDDRHDPRLPRERSIPVGGLILHVSHGDELGHPTPERLLARYGADVLVYGHTHRAMVFRSGGRLVVNPGAAGPRRFNVEPSVAIVRVAGTEAEVEILPL